MPARAGPLKQHGCKQARFREDVSWLARLPPGVEYHVMQKGGAVQRELPACRQTALPNVGREAHAYLSCEV